MECGLSNVENDQGEPGDLPIGRAVGDGCVAIGQTVGNVCQVNVGARVGACGATADQKRFLRIARGSVYEAKHWLRLAFMRGLLDEKCIEQLKPLMDKLPPNLNAYMRAVGRNKGFETRQSTIDNR